jgi:hypothetical protein
MTCNKKGFDCEEAVLEKDLMWICIKSLDKLQIFLYLFELKAPKG